MTPAPFIICGPRVHLRSGHLAAIVRKCPITARWITHGQLDAIAYAIAQFTEQETAASARLAQSTGRASADNPASRRLRPINRAVAA